MTTAYEAPHDELDGPYWSGTRIALVVVVLLMVTMWVWIYLFAPRENADRMSNREFAERAQPACSAFQADVDALPFFSSDTTISQKALQVDNVTAMTRDLVGSLRAIRADLTFDDPDDDRLLDAWFFDWDTYLDDRDAYVAKLYDSPDVDRSELVFTITARATGGQYTDTILGSGNVNDMASCHVPRDI